MRSMLDAISMFLLLTSQTLQTKLSIDGIIKLTACAIVSLFESAKDFLQQFSLGVDPESWLKLVLMTARSV